MLPQQLVLWGEGGERDWHILLKITLAFPVLPAQAAGKAPRCTMALKTSSHGVLTPRWERWGGVHPASCLADCRVARAMCACGLGGTVFCLGPLALLMVVFICPGWQPAASWALWQLKCTHHGLASPTLLCDTALSCGRCGISLGQTWHLKRQQAEQSTQQKISQSLSELQHYMRPSYTQKCVLIEHLLV